MKLTRRQALAEDIKLKRVIRRAAKLNSILVADEVEINNRDCAWWGGCYEAYLSMSFMKLVGVRVEEASGIRSREGIRECVESWKVEGN